MSSISCRCPFPSQWPLRGVSRVPSSAHHTFPGRHLGTALARKPARACSCRLVPRRSWKDGMALKCCVLWRYKKTDAWTPCGDDGIMRCSKFQRTKLEDWSKLDQTARRNRRQRTFGSTTSGRMFCCPDCAAFVMMAHVQPLFKRRDRQGRAPQDTRKGVHR